MLKAGALLRGFTVLVLFLPLFATKQQCKHEMTMQTSKSTLNTGGVTQVPGNQIWSYTWAVGHLFLIHNCGSCNPIRNKLFTILP